MFQSTMKFGRDRPVYGLAIGVAAMAILMGTFIAIAPASAEQEVIKSVDSIQLHENFTTSEGLNIVSLRYNDTWGRDVRFDITSFTSAGMWRCSSYGADGVMPEVTFRGKDVVHLEASIPAEAFTWCNGPAPAQVEMNLDLVADVVLHERSSSVWTTVKGDAGNYTPHSSKYDRWQGMDVSLHGAFNGDEVLGTSYASFDWTKTIKDTYGN